MPVKKIFICILVSLFYFVSSNQVFASTGFSLVQGGISGNYLNNALLSECFGSLKIDAVFSEKDQMYHLSGEAKATSGEYELPFGREPFVGSDTGTLKIWGTYDPATGGFGGAIDYTEYFNGSRTNEDLTNYILVSLGAQFLGYANSGDNSVTLTFDGNSSNGETFSFTVTFAVEGASPFAEAGTTKLKDSGAAFSDLSGQVEVLVPTGYDANGDPEWDEEAWTFAKLDMPLPEGTRIKTSERSSVILSFSDMTTFVMKPESEIWLSKPEAGAGPFKLLIGHLWVSMKKGIIDGTMDIEMSQAASGIKGTTFVLEDDGDNSTLKVIEGTVEFTSKSTGESIDIEAGGMVSATEDGLGEVKTFDTNAEMAGWAEYGAEILSEGFPLWAILTIAGSAVVIVLVVVTSVVLSRKKRAATVAQSTYTQGEKSAVPITFCTHCGAPLTPGAAFCAKCGKKTGI